VEFQSDQMDVPGAEASGAEVGGAEFTGAGVGGAQATRAEAVGGDVSGAEATGAEVGGVSQDVEMQSASNPSSDETVLSSESSKSKEGLSEIKEQLKNLTTMFQQVLQVRGIAPPQTIVVEQSEKSVAEDFGKTRSVKDLLLKFPFLETNLREEDVEENEVFTEIICTFCLDPLDPITKRHGIFRYSSTNGIDFHGKKMCKAFTNLKQHISSHIKSPLHIKNSEMEIKNNRARMIMLEKNQHAGMILGRAAYMAVKVDHNVSKYEHYVALNAANKVAIGDENHSRHFARKFGHHAFGILQKKLIDIMNQPLISTGKPPPFAIIADKYTANRLTGQITGIITFFDGEIKAINVDFPLVHDHSGSGIANTLKTSIETLMCPEHIRHRYVTFLTL
jgi:hypothetical protein